jgi:hypothetical protein
MERTGISSLRSPTRLLCTHGSDCYRGSRTFLAKTVILRGAMQYSQAQTWKSLDIHFHPDRRNFAQLIRAQAADFSAVIF